MVPPLQFPFEIEADRASRLRRLSANQAYERERTHLRVNPGRVISAENLERNRGTVGGVAVPAQQVQRMHPDVRTPLPEKIPPSFKAVVVFS